MTALSDLIAGTPGLIYYLPLQEPDTATPVADLGPNAGTLTRTRGAAAAAGATAIVPGDAFAARLSGATNSYIDIGADALIRPAGDFSAELFLIAAANPAADTSVLAGGVATQNLQLYRRSNGAMAGRMEDTTPTSWSVVDSTALGGIPGDTAGLVHLAVARWGHAFYSWVNGALVSMPRRFVPLPTRQAVQPHRIGSAASSTMDIRIAHVAFYGRALRQGEVRARCVLAGLEPSVEALPTERSSDQRGRGVALANVRFDAGSGTKISAGEAMVVDSVGATWTPSSYAAWKPESSPADIAVTPVAASRAELCLAAGRMTLEALDQYTRRRTTANDAVYMKNGQFFNSVYTIEGQNSTANNGSGLTAAQQQEWRNVIGIARGASILHRYGGERRGTWLYRIAYDAFESVIKYRTNYAGQTGNIGGDTFWALEHMAPIYVNLLPVLPAAVAARWRDFLMAGAEYDFATYTNKYYVNGNIEFARVKNFWYAWQMVGTTTWRDRVRLQLDFAINQTGIKAPQAGFQWVESVAPSNGEYSDGQGYFREAGSGLGDDGIAGHPGKDWNYSNYQSMIGALAYMDMTDPEFAVEREQMCRFATMAWNTVDLAGKFTKNTTSGWRADFSGGSRGGVANTVCNNPYPVIMAHVRGRAGMQADAASMVRSHAYDGPNSRAVGDSFAEIMKACATDYPEVRIR